VVTASYYARDDWLLAAHVERHVFLSAHFDDVAFSCGGTVARLAAAGRRPVIVVVFAAVPGRDAVLTPFAQAHDAMWGIGDDPASSNAGRQTEERASTALLGAELRTLPFLDAIYRADRYDGNENLFGVVHSEERGLPQSIAAAVIDAVGTLTGVRLYVPLAVGRHVDHQLAFLAGKVLAGNGGDVWCYEDLPYSLRPETLQARQMEAVSEIGAMESVVVDGVWPTRVAAVMAHRSQLASAFGYVGVESTRSEIAAALARFAARGAGDEGQSGRQERFWVLRGT